MQCSLRNKAALQFVSVVQLDMYHLPPAFDFSEKFSLFLLTYIGIDLTLN